MSANYQSNNVSVMLNNGSAVFAAAAGSPLATGTRPVAVALADFDGDTDLDIAVTSNNTNTVSILLNNGAGGFTAAAPRATGVGPRGIAAGDLDGDGDVDLVVANFGANTLSILLNNGVGRIHRRGRRAPGDREQPLRRDGGRPRRRRRPRYRGHQLGCSSVSVFLNIGSASFTPATGSPFAVGVSPGGIVMGDFDGDGYLDLSTANFGSNTTSILINASVHLVGTTGNDPLTGGIGNDLIEGLGGDDSIAGGDGQDRMFGGAGNDVLDGGAGIDAMFGGAGNDAYFVDNIGDQVIEGVGEGSDTVFSTAHFRLSANVENLVLQGTADLQGGGNSLVNVIQGNAGNNILDGDAGADAMFGGAGNDLYYVDNAGDQVFENANEGADTVFSTAHFRLSANVENLVLQGTDNLQAGGNSLVNVIYGNAGSNILDGDAGADIMVGGAGNDLYYVDNAGDQVFENANEGNDTVFSTAHLHLTDNVENLVLQGSDNLQAHGNGLSNVLYGNTGNNILDGDAGADVMFGGAGNDAYFVDNAGDLAIENVNEGNDTVFSTANLRLSANVEALVLQGNADLQGGGNSLVNVLQGNAGNNILDGDAGADAMFGGAGSDVYFVDNAGDVAIENLNEGNDTVFSTANLRLSANVETLVLQGTADLQGGGNSLVNRIHGNAGNNILDGDAGADAMFGGAGSDVYFVDNAGDVAIENLNEGNDTVFSTANLRLSANVETLVLQGTADLQGGGNSLVNRITATPATICWTAIPEPTPCSAGPATTSTSSTMPATWRSRTSMKATIPSFRPRISDCQRTWKRWCCKALPICREAATAS